MTPTEHSSAVATVPAATTRPDCNPDLITGEPGSHPIGTGVGAAAGGAAGAAVGALGGPVGMAVGAVVGAVAGGLGGKGVGELVDPTEEDAYWRTNHSSQPYANHGRSYDDYSSAYRTGYTGYTDGKTFDEREADLAKSYDAAEAARIASRASATPGAAPGNVQGSASTGPVRWDEARAAARKAYGISRDRSFVAIPARRGYLRGLFMPPPNHRGRSFEIKGHSGRPE